MSSRPKRLKVCDESVVRELLDDIDDDFSSFSEFDDSDEDEHYVPSNESDNIQSDSGHHQKQFIFSKNPGFKVEIPNNATALQYFKLFITDEIIDLIVLETNRNADQVLSKFRLTKSSRFLKWTPTDATEIQQFLGLLMWMGLVQMPSLKDYWSLKIMYKNSVAKNIMSRNRFELILRFWHFSDNEQAPENDRIFKVRNLIQKIVNNFQNAMEPEEMMAVDETKVPFRGRLKFKQYIPGKAHKYGIKLFKLCGANGYTYNIQVYAGKGQDDGRGLGCSVVMNLTSLYLNAGRTIITDNFYTSLNLANALLENETHLVGTLRCNRVKLPEVTKSKLKPGQIIGKENLNGVVVAKWRDKRDVTMLSTRKAGIDLSDQLSSYSSPVRKSIRWYHKVATEILLGTAVVNALIVHNLNTPQNKLKITQFREALINEILGLNQPLLHQDSVPTSTSSTSRRTSSKHMLDETSEKCTRNRKIRKRCYIVTKIKLQLLDQFRPTKKLKELQLCVRNVMCILVWTVF
ncbi:piggyBac transposable element-derived protein 4-like [Aphis gossypii]|uniref:piggyBac transposable element-derived protein 4-like n=1 Tax=Aphis gossypii TaxID=80765 RepID=UPI0021591D4F|nr:piggyBac transposable element-derived protein 4-like [Aphis gossypii]